MTATPLNEIHLPERAVVELSNVDVTTWIDDRAITVGRAWWTDALTAQGLDDSLERFRVRAAVQVATEILEELMVRKAAKCLGATTAG